MDDEERKQLLRMFQKVIDSIPDFYERVRNAERFLENTAKLVKIPRI